MKGLTPLIATVLLIGISMVIATILLSWSESITSEQTSRAENRTKTSTSCPDIIIDSVFLDFTKNVSRVIVRSMNGASEISSGSLLNSNGVAVNNITQFPLPVESGQVATLEFNIYGNITKCSDFGEANVVTVCTSDKYSKNPSNCG
jgi:FlaG/FlaF family flagellin (archaellin)